MALLDGMGRFTMKPSHRCVHAESPGRRRISNFCIPEIPKPRRNPMTREAILDNLPPGSYAVSSLTSTPPGGANVEAV